MDFEGLSFHTLDSREEPAVLFDLITSESLEIVMRESALLLQDYGEEGRVKCYSIKFRAKCLIWVTVVCDLESPRPSLCNKLALFKTF